MERRGDEIHVETTEASGASREGVVRWVLIIGTLLAIVLLSIIWMTGALTQSEVEEEGSVGGRIVAQQDDDADNDAIVGEGFGDMEAPPGPGHPDVPIDRSAVDDAAQAQVRGDSAPAQ